MEQDEIVKKGVVHDVLITVAGGQQGALLH